MAFRYTLTVLAFGVLLTSQQYLTQASANTPQATAQVSSPHTGINEPQVQWAQWGPSIFARAKKEHKPIVLDLEAIWCHWCHVMNEKTYANREVASLLSKHFISVRVDQDSHPDLSIRYQYYGWPATTIFSPSGQEIVKESGYIPPADFLALLKKVARSPFTPQFQEKSPTSYAVEGLLSAALSKSLQRQLVDDYDTVYGGFNNGYKFLDWDTVEYFIAQAQAGDKRYERMASQTLRSAIKLIDPVWGGMCQYSTDGDWVHAHFEKLMQVQSENMRIFCLAYKLWRDPLYLKAATQLQRFLSSFMTSPEGAFYTSMDADVIPGKDSHAYFKLNDQARRQIGIPRIDKHIYSSENGRAIVGLVALYGATGDNRYLASAIKAANWIVANRFLAGGGFSHTAGSASTYGAKKSVTVGTYLDDTLSMGRAFLSLYGATGDRRWLTKAEQAANFIDTHFRITACKKVPGYVDAVDIAPGVSAVSPVLPLPNIDQNVMVARFANLLYYYDGNKQFEAMAKNAMRFLATPAVTQRVGSYVAGILLANSELAAAPIHITIVGHKDDPAAQSLMLAALAYPSGYKVTEWWDKREGRLPHMDIEFPDLSRAAAFACANQRCSLPAFEPADVARIVNHLKRSNHD